HVETDTKDWNKTQLYIQQERIDKDSKNIFAYLGEADIGEICNTLAAYAPHIVKFENQLDKFRFNAQLNNLKIRYDLSGIYQTSFQYSAKINNAQAWDVEGNRKVSGINATLRGGDIGGQALISSENLSLNLPDFYPENILNFNTAGDVEWINYPESFLLRSNLLTLKNNDIDLNARLKIQQQGEDIYTDSQFYISAAKANRVGSYFPSSVGIDLTKSWLMNAIEAGEVTKGQVLLRGDLKEFPFQDDSGVFQINVGVSHGVLEYLSGWPELKNVQAKVKINKDRMDIYSDTAQMYDDTNISNVHVYIESYLNSILNINGTADGPTQNILRFRSDTGLFDGQNELSEQLKFQGNSNLNINISDSLSERIDHPLQVSGEVQLVENNLDVHAVDLQLEKLNGSIEFGEDGFTGKDITASIFNTPLFIKLNGQGDGTSLLAFEGNFNLSEYLVDQNPEFAKVLSGVVPVQGSIYLPDPADNENPDGLEVNITSSLQGLGIDLPEPFNKASNTTWPSSLIYIQNKNRLDFDIEKKLYLDFLVGDEGYLELRNIGIGKIDQGSQISESGHLTIQGSIDELNVDDWLAQYQKLFPSEQGSVKLKELPNLNINVNKLNWKTWPANDLHLIGTGNKHVYSLDIKSSHATGVISLPDDSGLPITINMSSFTLPEGQGESMNALDIKPSDFPPIEFSTKELLTQYVKLKDVGFSLKPTENGALIDPIVFAAQDMTAEGKGSWIEIDDNQTQSSISIHMESTDLEDTFDDLGFKSGMRKGEAKANLELHWAGAPYDASAATIAGKGDAKIKKGSIKELDPGAGRLLALLNLNALTRRLSLDFKDVTHKGFAFDSIQGKFKLVEGGELSTRKIEIKSAAADIRISGSTNIVKQTYNQEIIVTPSISGTLPAAGAIVGGPVGAAAGVVADRLARFVGLNKVVEYDYKMTGTWNEPVIEKVRSREVELKTNSPPSGVQPSGVQQSRQE
ncbi:MAG: DUF3971 domain-containing protein, partial [Pseudomonadota bacterium]